MTTNPEIAAASPYPLGRAFHEGKAPSDPSRVEHVIGEIERSVSGNAILRIGVTPVLNLGGTYIREQGWSRTAHVVLTPDERETLIAALVAQREDGEWTTPAEQDTGGDRLDGRR